MRRLTTFLFALILIAAVQAEEHPVTDSGPQWNSWSPEVFEQARRDGKLILVDLVADWCTFCKKMDSTTYRDPAVLDAIERDYIAVRADTEKEPNLPPRFTEYGRPSTVFLTPDGAEVLHKQGYLKPQWMLWMLQAVAAQSAADVSN